MSATRPAFSALAVLVGAGLVLPSRAEAMNIFVAKLNYATTSDAMETVGVTLDGGEGNAASVEVRVSSDGGSEDLELTESDAWLHGSAALSALPGKEAAVTLTLLDEVSASLMTFSGTLTPEGVVTFDAGKASGGCVSDSKAGCSAAEEPDLEVLASALYPSGKGYVLTLDLAGADTYAVAYAVVAVTGGEKAEVGFDAVGSVWTAEATVAHTGVIEVKAKARDEAGRTLANVHGELAEPWVDDGAGVAVLSAGEGTGVAISRWDGDYDGKTPWSWTGSREMFTVVSDGWTTSSYPTHAEVEVGGATASLPANSYHRHRVSGGNLQLTDNARFSFTDSSISISGGSLNFKPQSPTDLGSPQCSSGYCVAIVEAEKGYELSVSTYGATPAKLSEKQDFDLVLYDKTGAKVASERVAVTFDPAVTAVFMSALDVSGDPIGADASGSVQLLAPSTKKGAKGKDDLLVVGTFFGALSRDQDGDLGLGGQGTDEWATSSSSASIDLGEPVLCGGEGCDGDWTPPVILYGIGGKVTKIVVSSGGLIYNAF